MLLSEKETKVAATAEANLPAPAFDGTLNGQRLRALALIALSDELRPDAGAVLEELATQNIAFKIISGDNPETVHATIAHLVGKDRKLEVLSIIKRRDALGLLAHSDREERFKFDFYIKRKGY